MPVAPPLRWVVNRSVIEEDFLPEEEDTSTLAVIHSVLHASVLAVKTVEPGTGRIKGSRWQVAGALEQPVKFKTARLFSNVEDKSVAFTITLPSLLYFELRGEGPHRNVSN